MHGSGRPLATRLQITGWTISTGPDSIPDAATPDARLGAVRHLLAQGRRAQAADTARAALRQADRAVAPALAAALLELFNAAPYPAGAVIALRALKRYRDLAPGEGRRLFRLLDRGARAGLVDRYVRLLVRRLRGGDMPLRRAMIALWSTGRHQALVDFVRQDQPDKLADPQTFRFFAERSIHFGDHRAAVPVLAALLAVAPEDQAIRDALIRGQIECGAFTAAARLIATAPHSDTTAAALDPLAVAMIDALDAAPSPATCDEVRIAIDLMRTIDPAHAALEETLRALRSAEAAAGRNVLPDVMLASERVPIGMVARTAPAWVDTSDIATAIDALARAPAGSAEAKALRDRIEKHLAHADLAPIAPLLDRLLMAAPRFAHQIAARFADPDDGVALFAGFDPALPPTVWSAAMTLAERAGSDGAVGGFALRVACKGGVPLAELQSVGATVARRCNGEALDAFWLSAAESARSVAVGVAGLRALFHAPVSPAFYIIAAGLFDGSLRDDADPARLVDATRMVLARSWRRADAAALADARIDDALPEAMTLWLHAVLAWTQGDRVAALRHLDAGVALAAIDAPISFRAERALINWRFGHWGAAVSDLPAIAPGDRRGAHSRLSDVADLSAAMPLSPGALYPECLIDTIFDRPPTAPYAAIPGSVVTIITALASGGSEKQAVSVIAALAREPRVTQQTLLVRALDPEPKAFFLPRVVAANVPYRAFGDDPVDHDAVLAATGDAPGSALATALAFLPEWLRDSICQLVPLLREHRPAVVHIRQDFVAAALACVLAGVPRVILHRGSLSPDHWDVRLAQVEGRVRPMRHAYRRLIDWPGFAFVNNSAAGLATDRAWLERDDADRFHRIHNIVDFAKLGPSGEPNLALRGSLGIPPDAPVIGAAFRFQPVKRPMLWLGAARALRSQRPDAHFLIVGDGELRAVMTAFAAAHGFADRLHLPGTVEDVGPWYRTMTLALLTSDREGLPNLLIEAQHFGVPVLSTDVGGARETMDVGRTGQLAPVDATPTYLATQIATMIDDSEWYAAARAAAAPYVHKRFGAETTVTRLLQLYGFAPEW